jgi:hypothetical protein
VGSVGLIGQFIPSQDSLTNSGFEELEIPPKAGAEQRVARRARGP